MESFGVFERENEGFVIINLEVIIVDKETANYIRTYFSNLMTDDEMLALKYHIYTYKTEDNPKMRKIMIERGWFSDESYIKEYLKNGYEEFELNVAK